MLGLVFFSSGWKDISDCEGRSKSIEMSRGFTLSLGHTRMRWRRLSDGLILTQLAAIGLILIMLGAIQKKIFKWRSR
jgi:putative oxidoreductase